MNEENVVQLPTRLERLAGEIKSLLTRDTQNREEWIEIQMDLCLKLADGRKALESNIAFGKWCEDSGFGKDILNIQTRASAIEMGRDPWALRRCLEATKRRSLEQIYLNEFDRFSDARKTDTAAAPNPPSTSAPAPTTPSASAAPVAPAQSSRRVAPAPKLDLALEAMEKLEVEGIQPTIATVAKEANVSKFTAQAALRVAKHKVDPELLDPDAMAVQMRRRFDATVKAAVREAEAKMRNDLSVEYDRYLGYLKEREARVNRILASHKGFITRKQFDMIRNCLHSDYNKFKNADEAFNTFLGLEDVLVKPDEAILNAPPLPATTAELLARRRNKH